MSFAIDAYVWRTKAWPDFKSLAKSALISENSSDFASLWFMQ